MLTFSDICENDAKELAELDSECFSVPWSEKSFFNEASNSLACYVIARFDGELAGYAGFWTVADEGQITNIAVREKFRRIGVARSMLELLIQKAGKKGLYSLSLEVRESNFAAINLYTGFGFKKVGIRKSYYTNPHENAVLMDLILDNTTERI